MRARNNLVGPTTYIDLEEAERIARDGYEMATRFGHRPFLYQFQYDVLEVGLKRGDWDAWMAELDALEESDIFPFYEAAFAGARAIRLALRGDLGGAERAHARALAAAEQLQSIQVEAYNHLNRMWVRFAAGRWSDAFEAATQAEADSNFNVEAWWIAANAAAAGGMMPELDRAIEGLASPSFTGPITDAMGLAAGAARSARHERLDDARWGFGEAIGKLSAGGDHLDRHLAGLLWGGLLADRQPEAAAAASEAEDFFAARGADDFVRAYRAAFSPQAMPSGGGDPGQSQAAPAPAAAEA